MRRGCVCVAVDSRERAALGRLTRASQRGRAAAVYCLRSYMGLHTSESATRYESNDAGTHCWDWGWYVSILDSSSTRRKVPWRTITTAQTE
jgi:hypothetical protein